MEEVVVEVMEGGWKMWWRVVEEVVEGGGRGDRAWLEEVAEDVVEGGGRGGGGWWRACSTNQASVAK